MTAAALLAIALLASPAPAVPPACTPPPLADGPRAWAAGETLTYDLDLLGMVRTGTLQLSVERPMSGGRILPLRARARTDASLAALRNVTAMGFSWVDAATLRPERYRDESLEDGVRKVSDTRLEPPGAEVVVTYRYGEREGKTAYPRHGPVLDAVSAVYLLRAARLAPGDAFCFDLVANRRFWRLEGKVAQKVEPVDTPAGRFSTLRVDAVARRVDDPGGRGRPLHLWISNDSRRLLVAAVSEIDLGPVRAMLASVRGARRP